MKKVTITSPAKINLYLKLTGMRTDGYNNLCTVFQKLAFFDTLHFEKTRSSFSLGIEGIIPCPTKENLVYQAYALMKKQTSFKGGIRITMNKIIPAGSGLGGASSNAASTLLAINKLYKLKLKKSNLLTLGSMLGADVPLFIEPYTTALGIERGDQLIDLGRFRKYWVLLIVFNKKLSTNKVYKKFTYSRSFQLNLTKLNREVIMLCRFLKSRDMVSLQRVLKNDLYCVACSCMPSINTYVRMLQRQTKGAWYMTGSGPTVFGIFTSKKDVVTARQKLLSYTEIDTILCQTLL